MTYADHEITWARCQEKAGWMLSVDGIEQFIADEEILAAESVDYLLEKAVSTLEYQSEVAKLIGEVQPIKVERGPYR